jgi:hypothetical protein
MSVGIILLFILESVESVNVERKTDLRRGGLGPASSSRKKVGVGFFLANEVY